MHVLQVYGGQCSIYERVLLPDGNTLGSLRTQEDPKIEENIPMQDPKAQFLIGLISYLVEEHGEADVRNAIRAVLSPGNS